MSRIDWDAVPMTLIAAFDCGDHMQVVADSGAGDGLGGMSFHHEKVAQIGDYPVVWAVSGAVHLNRGLVEQLGALPYDGNLHHAIRATVGRINRREIDLISAAGNQPVSDQLLAGFAAGYWPERGPAIYLIAPNGTALFTATRWELLGAGADPARVALEAVALLAGAEFAFTDHALDAVCEAAALFRRQDVGRPFERWTITSEGVSRSGWIDRLLPAVDWAAQRAPS